MDAIQTSILSALPVKGTAADALHKNPSSMRGGACRSASVVIASAAQLMPKMESAMAMFSTLSRFIRHLFPVNEFHARGYPTPIGQGAVSIIVSSDGDEFAYLVGSGKTGMKPVAMVYASNDDDSLKRADYIKAKAIAMDPSRAGSGELHVTDLRGVSPKNLIWESLAIHAFFPTDRKGRRVLKAGGKPVCGSRLTMDGGIWTALQPESLWAMQSVEVPTFEMPGLAGGDWSPVPVALKNHLDSIEQASTKNGMPAEPIILKPASTKGNQAGTLTAA